MLTFSAETLNRVTTAIFRAAGTPDDIATVVAGSLVDSNLAGHDSHGVIHIPAYVDRSKSGVLFDVARPVIVREGEE